MSEAKRVRMEWRIIQRALVGAYKQNLKCIIIGRSNLWLMVGQIGVSNAMQKHEI
jgi:hypothetical protein